MYKDKKYIFNSSGWQVGEDLQKKTNSIIDSLRKKRENKEIPIFSIIDSDLDLEEIIHNAKFFTDKTLKDFVLIGNDPIFRLFSKPLINSIPSIISSGLLFNIENFLSALGLNEIISRWCKYFLFFFLKPCGASDLVK